MAGKLYTGAGLRDALKGTVMPDDDFEEDCLKAASYEVRITADQRCITLSNREGAAQAGQPTRFDDDGHLMLAPGDSVLVESRERFHFPWDRTGLLGPKAGFARSGVIVSTGQLIQPGFGMIEDSSAPDGWSPRGDPLRFVLTNTSASEKTLDLGRKRIVHLQLFETDPIEPEERRAVETSLDPEQFDHFSQYATAALLEHRLGQVTGEVRVEVDEVETRVEALNRQIQQMKADTQRAIEQVKADAEQSIAQVKAEATVSIDGAREGARLAIDSVENGAKTVLVFGIYLVAATLLGLALAGIAEAVKDISESPGWVIAVVAAAGAVVVVAQVVIVTVAIVAMLNLVKRKEG